MIGNIIGQSSGGAKVNGVVQEYQVATNSTVKKGDFVKLTSNTISKANKNDTVKGLAKTSGVGGQTVKVIIPVIEEVN